MGCETLAYYAIATAAPATPYTRHRQGLPGIWANYINAILVKQQAVLVGSRLAW